MSLEYDKKDFEDYLRKAAQEPDPAPGSVVWLDDPFERKEGYHEMREKGRKRNRQRAKQLKKLKKRRR